MNSVRARGALLGASIVICLGLAGCSSTVGGAVGVAEGERCDATRRCAPELVCVAGTCVATGRADASGDAGDLPELGRFDDVALPDTSVEDTGGGEPSSALGRVCAGDPEAGCLPGEDAWPDCLDERCEEGDFCFLVTEETGGAFGFCARECASAVDCTTTGEGPLDISWSCSLGGLSGVCMPGSADECTTNDDCGAGVCRPGMREIEGALARALVCGPARAGGAAPGEPCNHDPLKGPILPCANDLCLGGVCTRGCAGDADSCDADALACALPSGSALGSFGSPLCVGAPCTTDASCDAPGLACAPDTVVAGTVTGRCSPHPADGVERIGVSGERCGRIDAERWGCASGICLGTADAGTCSALCEADGDCASDQRCGLALHAVAGATGVASLCLPDDGSGTACARDAECLAGEVCSPGIFPATEGVGELAVEGRCVQGWRTGAPAGEFCSDATACRNPTLCLGFGIRGNRCSALCVDDSDCSARTRCDSAYVWWDRATPDDPSDDLTTSLCVPR